MRKLEYANEFHPLPGTTPQLRPRDLHVPHALADLAEPLTDFVNIAVQILRNERFLAKKRRVLCLEARHDYFFRAALSIAQPLRCVLYCRIDVVITFHQFRNFTLDSLQVRCRLLFEFLRQLQEFLRQMMFTETR